MVLLLSSSFAVAQEPPSLENHQFFGTVTWNASLTTPQKVIAKTSSREFSSLIRDLSCAAALGTCNGTYGYATENILRVQGNRGEQVSFFVDTRKVLNFIYAPDTATRLDLDLTSPPRLEENLTGECRSNWNCTEWTSCINSWQNRTCLDMNRCDANESTTRETKRCLPSGGIGAQRTCEYQWSCGPFGSCIGNFRTRTCTQTDDCDVKKAAGLVDTVVPTPAVEEEFCVSAPTPSPAPSPAPAPAPTTSCFDNLKNRGETRVDCGGPCPACKEIKEEGGLPWYVYAGIGLLAALGILAAVYFLVLRGPSLPAETIEQLRNYFQRSLARGVSKEDIAEKLIDSGWDEKVVNKFLKKEKEL